MKKIRLFMFLFSPFLLGYGFAQEVYSNVVGYQRVKIAPGEKVMASVPFNKESTNTVASLFEGQLEGGTSAVDADVVRVFDRVTEAYGIFYPEVSAGVTNWSSGAALEALLPGKGVWIENQAGGSTNTVWLFGDVPTEPSITVPIRPGLQMVHYPYPRPQLLSESDLTSLGHAALVKSQSDLVLQWNPTHRDYDTYWLFNDAGTRKWVLESADPTQPPAFADFTMKPGQAFWYQRKKDLPAFDWIVQKPYSYP